MIPAGLDRAHVIAALARIDRDGIPPGREATKFELWHAGRAYPPKLVISLAREEAFGRALPSAVFSGGTETNRQLQELGFTIALKGREPQPALSTGRRSPTTDSVSSAEPLKHEHLKQKLLRRAPLYSWSELADRPGLPPATAGVYAWFFKTVPPGVPAQHCVVRDDRYLLYVGISPSSPTSSQTLRSRIRGHFRGNADGSTLRLTLGCLLQHDLGTVLRRVGSRNRMTFGPREAALSAWLAAQATVAWVEVPSPWLVERHILETVALPLNIDDNGAHPFCARLKALRAEARQRARSLPILATA